MPHFIIECSANVLAIQPAEVLMDTVHDTAAATGLFADNDIKVRIVPFEYYKLGAGKNSFLHIFGYIMQGRTTDQKAHLAKVIIEKIAPLLPDISFVSINISEFEAATYCNRSLIDPLNTQKNRHF
ncbi:MAG: 5-carboxymethyl-2-hydroxymuconate Delta-isomerase [Chitinophaga sp.]|uniref:5-carboxymethyl-2-hydroxymuconate Delta-isomerase n=1 Tax=Chitinophaga sp. TaxID=1869181 RepID=UPI001B01E281|nr:5-carboxymethyl-2-hydroxymuconate Delta-isomerase [Chitinophaga sp.]MBO9730235.1 5-carboxymethyl-2-hydroxymuconate Delta-isomerase [Chitinophaga sp.]